MLRGKIKFVLLAIALVGIMAGSWLLYDQLKDKFMPPLDIVDEQDTAEKGESMKAIDFAVLDGEGCELKLSEMRGKPVVLNFWASWCPPCKEEMPAFNAAFEAVGADVQFMMVNLADGSQETVETGAAYVTKQGFAFPVYYDTTGEASMAYSVRAIPSTVFIDAEGYVVANVVGAIDEAQLQAYIEMIQK